MIFLLLVACTSPERELAIEAEEESVAEIWTPDSEDSDGYLDPWEVQDTIACGSQESDPVESELEVLSPSFCLRLSPEPSLDDEGDADTGYDDTGFGWTDTGGTHVEDAASGGSPPPCGYFNLLGSIAASGEPEEPVVLYCDSDIPGGMRFVQVDGETQEVRTQMLESETCYADPDTGAMIPLDGGWLVVWIDLQAGPGIMSGKLSARGEWIEEMTPVFFEGTPRRLITIGSQLLLIDIEDRLWSIPVVDGSVGGLPLQIVSEARAVGATVTDRGLAVATCGADGGATVALVEDGAVAWTTDLEGSCFFDARPSIAWDTERLMVAWEQDSGGTAVLLDESGAVQTRLDLGEDARYPHAASLGGSFLLVDGSGQLRQLDRDGETLGTWLHPNIANRRGNISGLRLNLTEDLWGFTFIGNDIEVTAAGHANTFYYLEVSAVPVP